MFVWCSIGAHGDDRLDAYRHSAVEGFYPELRRWVGSDVKTSGSVWQNYEMSDLPLGMDVEERALEPVTEVMWSSLRHGRWIACSFEYMNKLERRKQRFKVTGCASTHGILLLKGLANWLQSRLNQNVRFLWCLHTMQALRLQLLLKWNLFSLFRTDRLLLQTWCWCKINWKMWVTDFILH